MHDGVDVVLVVEYSGDDLSPIDLLLGAVGTLDALDGETSFFLGEKFGGCGGVDEEEVDDGSEGDSWCALYTQSVFVRPSNGSHTYNEQQSPWCQRPSDMGDTIC